MRLYLCATAILLLAACGADEQVKDLDARIAIEGALPDPERQDGWLVDFGAVTAGGSATRELIVHNHSGGSVHVAPLELAPPFAGGGDGIELPPKGSVTIALHFEPTAAVEARTETILRAPFGETPLRLVGQGVSERVRCLPGVLDFGEVLRPAPKTLSVRCDNETAGPVAIHIDAFDGDAAFSLEGREEGEDILLAPGTSEEVRVTFAPTATARAEARLRLSTDGAWKLPVVRIEGLGLDGMLHVEPKRPRCIDFLPTPPGQESHAAILFENLTGSVRFATSAELPAGFSLGRHLPLRLEADDPGDAWWTGATWLPITFTPSALGPVEGVVRIETDDPATGTAEVCVRGFGGGPALVCDVEEIDFGEVQVGAEAIATLRCENQGAPVEAEVARLILYEVNANGAFLHASFETDERSIPPGGDLAIRVRVRTDRPGELYGAVLLMSSDPARPTLSVAVRGRAVE